MDLNTFLEKFLPDYEAKTNDGTGQNEFVNKHFPEALENFARLLCEKQRLWCAERAGDFDVYVLIENEDGKDEDIPLEDEILKMDLVEIKDLLHDEFDERFDVEIGKMGVDFFEWACEYFKGKMNTTLVKFYVMKDYYHLVDDWEHEPDNFIEALMAFCRLGEYTLTHDETNLRISTKHSNS